MGQKKQNTFQLNWQASAPFPFSGPVPMASGALTGSMASTNTIYSNAIDLTNVDNAGIEVNFTGTPTGTISVLCSNSGQSFYPLTFSPTLAQPSGSAGGYLVDLNQVPFRYVLIQYVNISGTGVLTAYLTVKDLN